MTEQEQAERVGHTAGPWSVVPEGKAQSRWIVGDAEGGSIADCEPPGPWMSCAEADANARLIAAAPDMLAALEPFAAAAERLRDQPDEVSIIAVGLTVGDLRKARAALSKATQGGGR